MRGHRRGTRGSSLLFIALYKPWVYVAHGIRLALSLRSLIFHRIVCVFCFVALLFLLCALFGRVVLDNAKQTRTRQLLMVEKALVDEHQYKTGKAALDLELKALLAKHQDSLEPNDNVRTNGEWC